MFVKATVKTIKASLRTSLTASAWTEPTEGWKINDLLAARTQTRLLYSTQNRTPVTVLHPEPTWPTVLHPEPNTYNGTTTRTQTQLLHCTQNPAWVTVLHPELKTNNGTSTRTTYCTAPRTKVQLLYCAHTSTNVLHLKPKPTYCPSPKIQPQLY